MKYYFLIILATLPSITEAQGEEVRTFLQLPFLNNLTNTANVAEGLFSIAIAIAAILVVIRLIWAGTQYMLSSLVTSKETAKKNIQDALIGLLIILGSVTILQTINPQLLNLNALGGIEREGGFILKDDGMGGAYHTGEFKKGDSLLKFIVTDFCKQEAPRDEHCPRRVEASLAAKCGADGGKLTDGVGWDGLKYRCEAK